MATSDTPPGARDIASVSDARSVIDSLLSDPFVCPWCFNRVKVPDEAYDILRDEHLKKKFRRSATEATSSTARRTDTAQLSHVPDRTDEVGNVVDPASLKTVCTECGTIDFDSSQIRGKDTLFDCLDNIADCLDESPRQIAFNDHAATSALETIGDKHKRWSVDDELDYLAMAVHLGIKYGNRTS